MTTTAVQKQPQGKMPLTLRQQLAGDYFKQQVALALPKHMTADRFVRVALTALMKTPKLLDCTPESVMECMLNCSALGLEPDGRRAHLIPYGNKCTLIIDYKGIVELAKRSGDVSNVFAQVVCENDSFEWTNGEIKHQIDFRRDRGEMYAAYAVISFKDGSRQVDVMTKHEIDAVRKRSRASGAGPWVTDYNEMAKKTVFRRASKWVTLSPEITEALEKAEPAPFSSASIVADIKQPEAAAQIQNEPGAIEVPAAAEDQIPGAEVPPEPAPRNPVPAKTAQSESETVQQRIAAAVEGAGFTFADFVKWGTESGNVEDASSIPDFDSIPVATARRLGRAITGMLAGIKLCKEGGAQ